MQNHFEVYPSMPKVEGFEIEPLPNLVARKLYVSQFSVIIPKLTHHLKISMGIASLNYRKKGLFTEFFILTDGC